MDAHFFPDSEDSMRRRVCRACDRCRLKKSKCDGSGPCKRCKTDNTICVFGERKKPYDKVYPPGYVQILEQQQEKLVSGIRELYARAINSGSWIGAPLQNTPKGYPLTHDILERLGFLRLSPHDKIETFEENTDFLQQRMMIKEEGNPYSTPEFSPVESPRFPFQAKSPEQASIPYLDGLGLGTSSWRMSNWIMPMYNETDTVRTMEWWSMD